MASNLVSITRRGFGDTARRDFWWAQPLITFVVFGSFVVYTTWAAFQGEHYRFGPYLSPLYSPELLGSATAWFGPKPGWFPTWLPFTAALLILWAPGGFRFTCYYYRGAYYKAFWAAFQNAHYTYGSYISPFYSPELFGDSHHAWFGRKPGWFPAWAPFSPALLILWAPGGFRFTCYYYRGAYYKAFWADPVSCAVGEPRKSYLGESSFPLIIQNIHRYFLLLALLFLVLLTYD